jgi:glucosylceramidase
MMIFDHNRDRIGVWTDIILSDPEAEKFISGVAFHWYSFEEDYGNLTKVHDKFPNKFLHPTEACHLDGVKLNDYSRGEDYGLDIIKDLNNFASGWTDWNLILDPHGGPCHSVLRVDAPIIADYINQRLYYQVMYYYLGHFTKFIPVGSVRIGVETKLRKGIHATAFKRLKDNATVLVVLNSNDDAIDFKIKDVTISEVAFTSVPPHGVKTFIWQNK